MHPIIIIIIIIIIIKWMLCNVILSVSPHVGFIIEKNTIIKKYKNIIKFSFLLIFFLNKWIDLSITPLAHIN